MRFNVTLLSIVVAFSLGLMWPCRLRLPTITEQQVVAHKASSNNSNITTEGTHSATANMLRKNNDASLSLPPLDSLLSPTTNKYGDVQFLFDFAIAGFAKTGTSSLMVWLKEHPEVRMQDKEFQTMQRDPVPAIQTQYELVSREGRGVTGYKSPHHIQFEQCLD